MKEHVLQGEIVILNNHWRNRGFPLNFQTEAMYFHEHHHDKSKKNMLVGGFNPSEKYEFVNWDDDIPN